MVPADVTGMVVSEELFGAARWAERHEVPLSWLADQLELRAILVQPETNELFYLRGQFGEYRALPPIWTFTDEGFTASPAAGWYPKPTVTRFGPSIFLSNPMVICAPFNRLAYAENNGPHRDWNGPLHWLSAGAGYVQAHFIGDMLQVIKRDFEPTRGRMA
jgi:hypothetical protein